MNKRDLHYEILMIIRLHTDKEKEKKEEKLLQLICYLKAQNISSQRNLKD